MTQVKARPSKATSSPRSGGDLPTIARRSVYLYDDHGRRIIDGAGGVGCVTSIGHAVREVVEAVADQLCTVAFVPWTQFQSQPAGELVERVARLTPPGLTMWRCSMVAQRALVRHRSTGVSCPMCWWPSKAPVAATRRDLPGPGWRRRAGGRSRPGHDAADHHLRADGGARRRHPGPGRGYAPRRSRGP